MRSRGFDLAFAGIPSALGIGMAVLYSFSSDPRPLFLALTWIFGFGHASAMFLRLYLHEPTRKHHWFLVWIAPLICIAFAYALFKWSVVMLMTVFLVSRFFHYIRQSHAFMRILSRDSAKGSHHINVSYVLPALAFFLMVHESPTFLGLPLISPKFEYMTHIWYAALGASLASALGTLWRLTQQEKPPTSYLIYTYSHIISFLFSCYWTFAHSISAGFIALTTWHGCQYLMFLWHYEDREKKPSSLQKSVAVFTLTTVALTAFVYGGMRMIESLTLVKIFFVGSMAINFHHYIAEAIIWRRPQKSAEKQKTPEESMAA